MRHCKTISEAPNNLTQNEAMTLVNQPTGSDMAQWQEYSTSCAERAFRLVKELKETVAISYWLKAIEGQMQVIGIAATSVQASASFQHTEIIKGYKVMGEYFKSIAESYARVYDPVQSKFYLELSDTYRNTDFSGIWTLKAGPAKGQKYPVLSLLIPAIQGYRLGEEKRFEEQSLSEARAGYQRAIKIFLELGLHYDYYRSTIALARSYIRYIGDNKNGLVSKGRLIAEGLNRFELLSVYFNKPTTDGSFPNTDMSNLKPMLMFVDDFERQVTLSSLETNTEIRLRGVLYTSRTNHEKNMQNLLDLIEQADSSLRGAGQHLLLAFLYRDIGLYFRLAFTDHNPITIGSVKLSNRSTNFNGRYFQSMIKYWHIAAVMFEELNSFNNADRKYIEMMKVCIEREHYEPLPRLYSNREAMIKKRDAYVSSQITNHIHTTDGINIVLRSSYEDSLRVALGHPRRAINRFIEMRTLSHDSVEFSRLKKLAVDEFIIGIQMIHAVIFKIFQKMRVVDSNKQTLLLNEIKNLRKNLSMIMIMISSAYAECDEIFMARGWSKLAITYLEDDVSTYAKGFMLLLDGYSMESDRPNEAMSLYEKAILDFQSSEHYLDYIVNVLFMSRLSINSSEMLRLKAQSGFCVMNDQDFQAFLKVLACHYFINSHNIQYLSSSTENTASFALQIAKEAIEYLWSNGSEEEAQSVCLNLKGEFAGRNLHLQAKELEILEKKING